MTSRSSIDAIKDPYRLLADVYDSIATKTDDSLFFVGVANTIGGPIVDLACGTGRLSFALALAGFEVVGIDRSEPMLAVASHHLARATAEIHRRLRLIRGDMLTYPLGQARYGMALIGFSSIYHVPHQADRIRLYAKCRRALRVGGALVLDNSFYPKPPGDRSVPMTTCHPQGKHRLSDGSTADLVIETQQPWPDPKYRRTFRFTSAEGRIVREVVLEMTYVPPEQTLVELTAADFTDVSVFDGYSTQSVTPDRISQRQVFVARP